MIRIPRVLTWSPLGWFDPGIAVAGTRSGGLGFLDLRTGVDTRKALDGLRRTGAILDGRRFGVCLDAAELSELLLAGCPPNLDVVVVSGQAESDWSKALGTIKRSGRVPVAEVNSRSTAAEAIEAGFEAFVVSGHEAGGFISDDSTFILLQAVLAEAGEGCRVWARGGIGPATAAGCVAAGAAGVVLDGALLLARESRLPTEIRATIERWDGVETAVFASSGGRSIRGYAPPGSSLLKTIRENGDTATAGWETGKIWPVGQDAALAAELARRFVTVGGIVQAVERAIDEAINSARSTRPLAENSPLAISHGTRYPIVQGPMTRVSDRPMFAREVAEGGALPFLALAMMSGAEVNVLLREATECLAGRAWGVGVLGFLPAEQRRRQTDEILKARPPFALIAGGRPDQAKELEREGIVTYLHVPSPGLLEQFLRDGARRFVLEGRECGGHVGPRSSFLLWEQAGRVVLEAIARGTDADEIHFLYAGGIHDARSSSVVAAIAAPLAARGVKVGVLVGTAYLFTKEAVDTGAIVGGFQDEAVRCSSTVLLETGPGHLVRVSPTPFAETFDRERKRLTREGRSPDEVRDTLEGLNVGRLRIAAKGVDREQGAGTPLEPVGAEDQYARGLYMLGQAATLRSGLTTVAELHRDICDQGTARLDQRSVAAAHPTRKKRQRPSDIAIIGMAAVVPGAGNVGRFWENTLSARDSITEVPADRWDWRLYYDADPKAPDKITSRWGGFVPEIPFDPLHYGMPPASLPSIEPLHLITLEVVRAALDDAGYSVRPFPRERTAVVLGAGGGAAQLAMGYAFRSYLPLLDTVIPGAGSEALAKCGDLLPDWTEDSFPGILLNVAAGRVANRFDLGGANYTVDAACGSSLAAAALAVRELESGTADMVILGGADTVQNPFTYLAFSKTHAFSPRGRCRPFDAKADGIVIAEGVAVVVLKRLADAERDGDRIYAVIKGIGASSDGREKSLTAPRYEGQVRALNRAYDKAGISPATIGYVEAHGTGTAAGDLAEATALKDVFHAAGTETGRCALGSVKSLIGHTKCAAGLAGLINASLALYHKVLPPTISVETSNPKADFPASPFHLSTRTRPWLGASASRPRRAGVSAFGFGGTNFHAVLEEYAGDPGPRRPALLERPAELFVWRAEDRGRLVEAIDGLEKALAAGPRPQLRDLAHTLSIQASGVNDGPSLAIVARSVDELNEKIVRARKSLVSALSEVNDPTGIAFAEKGLYKGERIAFLFPGQGSQSPDMLRELTVHFPEVLQGFDDFDAALLARGRPAVGPRVFPPPAGDDAVLERQRIALASPEAAQPALGAASVGLLNLLRALRLEPDALAGHSYGELVALHAGGVYSSDALAELSEARGRFLLEAVGEEPGAMIAVMARPDEVAALIVGDRDVLVANANGPTQSVLSGTRAGIARVLAEAERRGLRARRLPVACGYHSQLVAPAGKPLERLAGGLVERGPQVPVYANASGSVYPRSPEDIPKLLGEHLASPVRFSDMIETMYEEGSRIFVEVGPGSVLTGLVGSILAKRPYLATACEPAGKKGVAGLLASLGRLFVAGVSLDLEHLTASRSARVLTMRGDRFEATEPTLSPSTWMVNGDRARPAFGPEPKRFGPGPALPKPKPVEPSPLQERNGHVRDVVIPSVLHASANGNGTSSDAVFAAFQGTMQSFLDVQRSTMLGYLGSGRGPGQSRRPDVETRPAQNDPVASGPEESQPIRSRLPRAVATNGRHGSSEEVDRAPSVEARLLEIVRERTGYPSEMLKLDLDLEADLGIDSIKRVEILGTLRDYLPGVRDGSETELMDQLGRARTLGAIVEEVNRHLGPDHQQDGKSGPSSRTHVRSSPERSRVRRRVIRAVDAPIPIGESPEQLTPGGVVLITDDGRGVAAEIARRLRVKGYIAIRVVHAADDKGATGSEPWSGDLSSPETVARLIERVRAKGRITAVVHALPLGRAREAGLDQTIWRERLRTEVRGLFLIAKACAGDLLNASVQGGASLVAATGMGGGFASVGEPTAEFFPGHGAIAGLVKTLAREWDGVRARVVDLDPREEPVVLGTRLVDELLANDRRAEVGYLGGRRIALRAVGTDLPGFTRENVCVRPGEPILITGGARGITAEIATDLARRWRPTLLLMGKSPLPPEEDDADVAGLTDPATLRSRLFHRADLEGKVISPGEVERRYQSLRRDREIRVNLKALRQAGAVVEYASVDVRNGEALRTTLERWREIYGSPVGLIHAAGLIEDKLLGDKTLESFDRVFGPKVEGALALARLIDPEPLRFAVFFSSVAGRFGNRGQVDYAAANDALNKLSIWLDQRWPGRVVSINWGPWSDVGMVSDLEQHLGRQGLGMIAPGEGRSRLAEELMNGRKGDVEVILAGELGNLVDPAEASDES